MRNRKAAHQKRNCVLSVDPFATTGLEMQLLAAFPFKIVKQTTQWEKPFPLTPQH